MIDIKCVLYVCIETEKLYGNEETQVMRMSGHVKIKFHEELDNWITFIRGGCFSC